jgi:peptide/nickel transport system substrate-binding protein
VLRRFAISLLLAAVALRAPARTRPHYGGTMRVEVAGDGIHSSGGSVLRLILDGLTQLGTDGTPQPDLAVSWKSENSDHRWEFQLRQGVQFQNGFPLTTDRVVASLNQSCNGNCPWTAVRAVGSSVVFLSDSPVPNLPWLLTENPYLISLTDSGDGKVPPCCIGTGPFEFNDQNQPRSLVANDSYWHGRPFVDKIEILTGRSIRDQWLDLSVGRADVVEVPPEELRQAQQQRLTVVSSTPVELLALEISETGALANPMLRASIAEAVDRAALFNVIFQKQGEITASLLPQEMTGYAFLFPTGRDLNKAQELRGGLNAPPLTMGVAGSGAMMLAAQRLALNLREAGFDVQPVDMNHVQHPDLVLRTLPLEGADASAAMEGLLRAAGEPASVPRQSTAALFRAEREFLERKTLVPLIDLPRAYAIGPRVRDFQLGADGTPDLASASLEDTP